MQPKISLDKGKGVTLKTNAVKLNSAPKVTLGSIGKAKEPEAPTLEDLEKENGEDISEVLKGFRERAQQEAARFIEVTDSEFFVCVCFQTREQKEEFLQEVGLDLERDGDKYIDGMVLAKKLGITLKTKVPPIRTPRVDKTWNMFVDQELPTPRE